MGTISLALELSSRSGSVGLGCGGEWLGAEEVCQTARHHDDVMPAIGRLFERFGFAPSALGEIHVSLGPGGFTGIRLAATTAKMLAFATGAKIVAVPTGAVLAEGVACSNVAEGEDVTLIVALATKRGVSWCHVFDWQGLDRGTGVWATRGEAGLFSLAELVAGEAGRLMVCSSLEDSEMRDLAENRRTEIESCSAVYSALNCWTAARRQVNGSAEGAIYVAPGNLVPCYGREPEAVRLWEARQRD